VRIFCSRAGRRSTPCFAMLDTRLSTLYMHTAHSTVHVSHQNLPRKLIVPDLFLPVSHAGVDTCGDAVSTCTIACTKVPARKVLCCSILSDYTGLRVTPIFSLHSVGQSNLHGWRRISRQPTRIARTFPGSWPCHIFRSTAQTVLT
jgi:hypothetical protein